MTTNNFNAFNESELERNIDRVKEAKHTCTFKLNLLRDAATSSVTHLATFESLENRLCNAQEQIFDIEAKEKDRKKVKASGLGIDDGDDGDDGDEIRYGLKKSMSLIGAFDRLAEDIATLKFVLEEPKAAKMSAQGTTAPAGGSQNNANLHEHARPAPAASSSDNNGTAAKKQKLNTENQTAAQKEGEIKQEENVPKRAKETNWAPVGYHYVKAHFRRNPKRKLKGAQQNNEEDGPASYEIVEVE